MKFCTSALGGLILLIISTGSESAAPVVKVEFNGTAVLPCTEKCFGVASWTRTDKSTDILAECDQTSCRSLKEGYQMIYNQYLQGDLSLIITEVDYSKRGHYTCECDNVDKCDTELQIKPRRTSVQKKSGDSLVIELEVLVLVEVIYRCTKEAGTSNVQICTVAGESLQFSPKYKHRTSLSSSTLELRELEESDSGIYIIRDTDNNWDIHIYTVTVTDKQHPNQENEETPTSDAGNRMRFMLALFGAVFWIVVSVVVILRFKKNNKFCFKKSEKDLAHSGDSYNKQNIYSPEKSPLNHQQV